jgi:predicted kinase
MMDEPEFSAAEKETAVSRARSFFELARRYAAPLLKPTVIAVAGLSGTGKTSLARAIAGELGLRVVSSDAIRQSLFGEAKRPAGYGEGAYTAEANRLTYQTFIESGRGWLSKGQGLILDATFRRRADREMAREIAAQAGAEWRLIECRLSPELVRTRLNKRVALREGLSDATWETFLRQREVFDAIAGLTDVSHLVLETDDSLTIISHTAADWLRKNDLSPYRK